MSVLCIKIYQMGYKNVKRKHLQDDILANYLYSYTCSEHPV